MTPIPTSMKAPGDYRQGIWRGRVLQVKVTSFCDLDCKNCSVGVGIAKKLKRSFTMTPDQFRTACRSLKGFPGVIGMFGGNPCIHPKFEELCDIFRQEIPNMDQRGLWSNNLFGHGAVCRKTFNPRHSNLNVHGVQAAFDEMKRDWPESQPLASGLSNDGTDPSKHGPIFGAPMEIGVSETDMWKAIGNCEVNQHWSAEITVVDGELFGYFCEIAGTMAELENDPMFGYQLADRWWARGMPEFESQVRHYCTRCLIPLNPHKVHADGRDAANDIEEFTPAWRPVMLNIKGRPTKEVATFGEIAGGDSAVRYLPRGVMPAGHK